MTYVESFVTDREPPGRSESFKPETWSLMVRKGIMVSRLLGCFLIAIVVNVPLHAAQQSDSTERPFRLQVSTNLVVEDVVVTDAHGNPIRNLTRSDFAVLEDGHPQAIKRFGEHTADVMAHLPPTPQLPPGTFTNDSVTPTDGALNILLLDKLNTPFAAQGNAVNEVLKYLKGPRTDSRIAIFVLTTQLKLLQGFTSDPDVLRALVEGKKALPGGSLVRTDHVSGDEPGADTSMTITPAESVGNSPDASLLESSLEDLKADQQSFQLMLRARYTLDAFNQLARYLSTLPGAKISSGFPVVLRLFKRASCLHIASKSAFRSKGNTISVLACTMTHQVKSVPWSCPLLRLSNCRPFGTRYLRPEADSDRYQNSRDQIVSATAPACAPD